MKKKPETILEYTSNNSGGEWWLTDKNWEDLEKMGWKIRWWKDETGLMQSMIKDDRWLGALAKSCSKTGFESMKDGVEEFETITGLDVTEEGCKCCGPPHSFRFTDKNGKDTHGPNFESVASWE